jgi:hypothetical protein
MKPGNKQVPVLPGAPLPADLRDMLDPGKIRDLDDVSDLVSGMIRAFCEGDIDIRRSKEIRQWTQLLFTSVAAKNPKQDAPVNLIAQLISMDAPSPAGRMVVDTSLSDPEATQRGYQPPRQLGEALTPEVLGLPSHLAAQKAIELLEIE